MRTISAALKAHLAGDTMTLATCAKVTLTNGTVIAITNHDQNIVISGWIAPNDIFNNTYSSVNGYSTSSLVTSSQMDVDNLEANGPQGAGITDAAIRAGLLDYAAISFFEVNWADLTMGPLRMRDGWFGALSTGRNDYKAELRGLMQAYSRAIGRIVMPSCDANLGDSRCTVNLTPFTVTSTITSVNADNVTLYDSARTEPGPTGGVAITGITNANPGVVTYAAGSTTEFSNGEPVTLAGILGPVTLNQVTVIRSLNATNRTFQLGVDTSNTTNYPPYVSGGTLTPFGSSGYFDFGVIKFTSGLNNGLSMEVKSYTVGQITLMLPMPNAVAIGDAYTMHAGCDKSNTTCKTRFSNIVNHRGFPFLPGVDKIVQVGRGGA